MDIGFTFVSDTDDGAGDGKGFRGPHRGAVVEFVHARVDLIEARRDLRIGVVARVDHAVVFGGLCFVYTPESAKSYLSSMRCT